VFRRTDSFFLQLDEEEDDMLQEEEDIDFAKERISETIAQQINEVKEKLDGIKV
jgi:isoleucyl-tRNA synthetase